MRLLPLELLNDNVHLPGIEHRQRRAAVRTDGADVQVHRRAAATARDTLDVLLEPRDLRGIEGPHEVLLAQELEERDEVAVLAGAPPVLKARVALHVRGEQETRVASRAREVLAERALLRGLVV